MRMRVCIVGAGAAGLASARQAQDQKYNHEYVIFERSGQIGGTWVYDERTGVDEFGLPIHTSMYKNLRTNLPKEVMGFPDYQIRGYEKSYITQEQILDFLGSYVDHYGLRNNIKFYHNVKNITPSSSGKWTVTVTSLKESKDYDYVFDGVMICNGHYHTPSIPKIPGSDFFTGLQIHSHDYRDSDRYRDRNVLVIGAGPSGMDIALQIAETAKHVTLSHHSKDEIATIFPDNFSQRPDVKYMTERKVYFVDDTTSDIDIVIYCTGFLYNFPFLSKECGIVVDDNHVRPLYKHLINIEFPTMCLVGLPFYVCAFSMFDLQARFYFETALGTVPLPTKREMLREMENEKGDVIAAGFTNKHVHMMGPKQGGYYKALSDYARISPLPPVLTKLHNESSQRFLDDLGNFREDIYEIKDDETFVQLN